jgi:hypothetical protein
MFSINGNVKELTLSPGQSVFLSLSNVVTLESTIKIMNEGSMLTHLMGPGKVILQSAPTPLSPFNQSTASLSAPNQQSLQAHSPLSLPPNQAYPNRPNANYPSNVPPTPNQQVVPPPTLSTGPPFGGGLAGAIVEGVTFGIGSSLGHRMVDSVLGPRTMNVNHAYDNNPQSQPGQPPQNDQSNMNPPMDNTQSNYDTTNTFNSNPVNDSFSNQTDMSFEDGNSGGGFFSSLFGGGDEGDDGDSDW